MTTAHYARALLARHEGLVSRLAADSEGLTIGYGRNVILRPLDEEEWRALFAWGLSVSADGAASIKPEFADWVRERDIARGEKFCSRWRGWKEAGPARQAALVDAFHAMGDGLGKFTKMRVALGSGDYGRAGDELFDSNWGRHPLPGVRARAKEVAEILRSGQMPEWYKEG